MNSQSGFTHINGIKVMLDGGAKEKTWRHG